MPFAQLVIGSPGSGKSTYCNGLSHFLPLLSRPCSIINLDPANDSLPYPCAIDINHLISVRDVMAELHLGPNAAMLYCIEYLETNLDWLIDRLGDVMSHQRQGRLVHTEPTSHDTATTTTTTTTTTTHTTIDPVPAGSEYLVFDLPGQVELSTNHPSLRRILGVLEKQLQLRFVAVHMTDATHITDPSRYVSLLLLALRAMLALELPHVNVLSKVDLLGQHSRSIGGLDPVARRPGQEGDDDDGSDAGTTGMQGGLSGDLAFNLDFYTQVQDLSYLYDLLLRPSSSGSRRRRGPSSDDNDDDDDEEEEPPLRRDARFAELNRTICELVEDFGLVQFETLAVEDRRSMFRLLQVLDKAVGYVYVGQGEEPFPDDDDDDGGEGDEERGGRYESGSAAATAGLALWKQGASARALFSTADRGDPLGWGDALEVQERYVDHRHLYDAHERKRDDEARDKLWERRVWDEVNKVSRQSSSSHDNKGQQPQ
ncbi:uncharacterized protein PFL1_05050 [Pseudozyma flocculosa PF-1]|uniref:GPN-loop GTPase 2 n=2 Tax=Pseudozyma flocculosa TaxID=84751 RepID=A0A5C3EUV8_9BASI|nr:uncharacterized protein PFL1_05050 [Pseudozyma flocculosa PF-1]EPQ27512.1 hypothetical protein PFL1_05050 [Pseudozyma flocculosa PF-1]SPO36053.1 uncharacterized protein PSFLO_01524 [Pseudozyma flocculosa]